MSFTGYDNGENFFKALSSFWTVVHEDKDALSRFMAGYGELFSDAYFNFLEAILGKSIHKIPVFDKKKWFFLTFLESENLGNTDLIYSDTGIVYGPQTEDSTFTLNKEFEYGAESTTSKVFTYRFPDNMVGVDRFLMNRIHSPSLVMTKDTEFTVDSDNRTITFLKDPFQNPLISTRVINDSQGNPSDKQAGIWVLNSFWDFEYVWRNFGTLVGFKRPSSEEYKLFVQALWELFRGGPNFVNIEAGINALIGLPISQDDEVIEQVFTEENNRVILTNLNIYKIPKIIPLKSSFFSSEGSLKPNIALKKFGSLTDVVKIQDHKSNSNWWRDVDPLIIPKNLTSGDDFLLPEGINIYADNRIGSSWGLPEQHKAPSESFRTLGLRVGEWVIGKESSGVPLTYKFDYKDFVMETFFKDNLFFLSISPTVLELENFEQQVVDVIKESIPAYCTFLNYTYLDSFKEDFSADTQTGTLTYDVNVSTLWDGESRIKGHGSDFEVLDVGTGPEFTEEIQDKSTVGFDSNNNLGYEDGSIGIPLTGLMVVGGFSVGKLGFNSNLTVISVCGA